MALREDEKDMDNNKVTGNSVNSSKICLVAMAE